MESAIGVYKTELIDRDRSWSNQAEVERETAAYVHWYNTDRLHSSIGYCSRVEYESLHHSGTCRFANRCRDHPAAINSPRVW